MTSNDMVTPKFRTFCLYESDTGVCVQCAFKLEPSQLFEVEVGSLALRPCERQWWKANIFPDFVPRDIGPSDLISDGFGNLCKLFVGNLFDLA